MKLEITPLAAKYAPWSISKAGTAEICPRQYEHKYILKSKELTRASANKVGTVSHKILELRVVGTDASVAEKAALEEEPLTSAESEDLRSMKDAIDVFVKDFDLFCRNNGVTEIFREVKWGLTKEGAKTGFFDVDVYFRGVMDLGCMTRDRDLIVMDHKSGLAKDISKDQKLRRQLNSYAVLGLVNVPDMQGARGMINFLQGPPAKRRQWMEYVAAERILKQLTPWLFSYLSFCAEQLVEPMRAKPKFNKFPCAYCAYRPACEAYKELELAAEV